MINSADKRYEAIFKGIDVEDKTLLDLCCHDGYFYKRFMREGGRAAVGVDNDPKHGQLLSFDLVTNPHFDIGLYLDTHYHTGTEGYLERISSMVTILFTSCAYRKSFEKERSNEKYAKELMKLWNEVKPIYTGPHGRIIFRCE